MQFPTTLGTSTGPDSDWGKGPEGSREHRHTAKSRWELSIGLAPSIPCSR